MKIKFTYVAIIFALVMLGMAGSGLFYWYELRPTEIRQACSRVTYTEPAQPAFAGITKEEALENQAKYDKCVADNPEDTIESWNALYSHECTYPRDHTVEEPPRPAVPAQEAVRGATETEYELCVRHYGL